MDHRPHKLRRIAVCHQSEHRFFLREIYRDLKRRFDSEIHVYCGLNQQLSFYDEDLQNGTIASVQCLNDLNRLDDKVLLNCDEVYNRAQEYEEKLGTTYNRLIMANRHLGRGYSLGGFYYPRSRLSEFTDYCAIVDGYNRQLDFWQSEFEKHDFTLVMFPTIELDYFASSLGVELRSFIAAGQDNYYLWTTDRYDQSRELEIAYESTIENKPKNIFGTYGSNEALMKLIDKRIRLSSVLKAMVVTIAKQIYWRFKKYDKSNTVYLGERLKSIYRLRQQMRDVKRLATIRLADMQGQRFVFFPLHEEPETVLTVGAPERIDQLAAIASVARDLPVGVKLVVKETYFGVGRRPDNFYQQISDFKNVNFMDMTERGVEVARQSDAIVTIRGTVGQEGAILGKPVILLARNAPYKCIPHVRLSQCEEELGPLLKWALSDQFDHKRARIDGARYHKALVSMCVDLKDYNYLKPEIFEQSLPSLAADALERSVAIDIPQLDSILVAAAGYN